MQLSLCVRVFSSIPTFCCVPNWVFEPGAILKVLDNIKIFFIYPSPLQTCYQIGFLIRIHIQRPAGSDPYLENRSGSRFQIVITIQQV